MTLYCVLCQCKHDHIIIADTKCGCICHYWNREIEVLREFQSERKQEMSETANSKKGDMPASLVSFEVALDDYFQELKKAVLIKAKEKGYIAGGEDSGRNLYDFIGKYATGHGIGEIIYKAIRWTRKRDPEDLVKIAAWAFLEWDHNRRFPNFVIKGWDLGIGESFTVPPKEIKEAHVGSQICKNCNHVHSAHIKDTVMNRLYCPIPKDGTLPLEEVVFK